MQYAILTHAGAGSSPEFTNLVEKAGKVGYDILEKGGKAIDAVEEAIVVLEDDERTNAGLGSRYRLSGVIQMDASIMDSEMNCGCVAAIENVRNPIRVARCVMQTPHVILCGEGALNFARSKGFEHFDPGTEKSRRILEKVRKKLETGALPPWAKKWKSFWTKDTVGAVAMDAKGGFAAGNSTGGTSLMLEGRIGDTPVVGAGLYAGEKGAVTVTGIGEEIIRHVLSKRVYDQIEDGQDPQTVCDASLKLFHEDTPTGILAISSIGYGVSCNTQMAWWVGEG